MSGVDSGGDARDQSRHQPEEHLKHKGGFAKWKRKRRRGKLLPRYLSFLLFGTKFHIAFEFSRKRVQIKRVNFSK